MAVLLNVTLLISGIGMMELHIKHFVFDTKLDVFVHVEQLQYPKLSHVLQIVKLHFVLTKSFVIILHEEHLDISRCRIVFKFSQRICYVKIFFSFVYIMARHIRRSPAPPAMNQQSGQCTSCQSNKKMMKSTSSSNNNKWIFVVVAILVIIIILFLMKRK